MSIRNNENLKCINRYKCHFIGKMLYQNFKIYLTGFVIY